MPEGNRLHNLPGNSILGGAANGLSYEGALRDAMAGEERERRLEAGRLRPGPRPLPESRREPRKPERCPQ